MGAIFVGSIETVWAGEITPPWGKGIEVTDYPVLEAESKQRYLRMPVPEGWHDEYAKGRVNPDACLEKYGFHAGP